MRRFALTYLLLTILPTVAIGQQRPPPAAAVYVGVGNAFGGIGVRGEYLALSGRLAGLVGIGVGVGGTFPGAPAVAASLRYYVGGRSHRAFGDLSWSVLVVEQVESLTRQTTGASEVRDYGPGLLIGYSYMSNAGLTLTAGGGLGLRDSNGLAVLAQLGVGWTWRRFRH